MNVDVMLIQQLSFQNQVKAITSFDIQTRDFRLVALNFHRHIDGPFHFNFQSIHYHFTIILFHMKTNAFDLWWNNND